MMDFKTDCRQVIETFPDIFLEIGRDLKIHFWNETAVEILGYTRTEVEHQHCEEVLCHLDENGEKLCGTSHCPARMTTGEPVTGKYYIRLKSGSLLPFTGKTWSVNGGETVLHFLSDATWRSELESKVQELEKLALMDNLTEIGNRRYGELSLDKNMDRFKRYGDPFGVLFLDIDYFKNFNDTYGHETGDRVLKMVALVLKYSIRPSDTITRWGGEEFLVILSNITPDYIENIARRIKNLIHKAHVNFDGRFLKITASIGYDIIKEGDTVIDLLARADSYLYKSKEMGRNLITGSFGTIK
ncbi:diguanylate cyclase [Myxococcota bacterium]|nr:diguanylate cyclase [Myxococcota bacterium]MBU1379926.1 diguanylate cyclase [Myxococcota bacterium]MBU1497389.1 diguanylate cyclase [Myxococcota bacterium]